jgi:hypothetical protein
VAGRGGRAAAADGPLAGRVRALSRGAAQPGVGGSGPDSLPDLAPAQRAVPRRPGALAGALTFRRLKWTSFAHSAVYLSLLISAFAAGQPEPLTAALGWTHGILWIGMSFACLSATRLRVIPLRVAVAVAVLGGVGPFFGSLEFVREQRRRLATQADNSPR